MCAIVRGKGKERREGDERQKGGEEIELSGQVREHVVRERGGAFIISKM